jgi:hypothetical protein
MADVHIHEVRTEIEVTEPVGSLDPADVKKLIAMMMEHLATEQHHRELRRRDDRIGDRAFESDVGR